MTCLAKCRTCLISSQRLTLVLLVFPKDGSKNLYGSKPTVYYGLNGRRLDAPKKGKNIVKGKKVIF